MACGSPPPNTLKSPRVIIYDVPTDVEADALTDAVWRQNPAVSDIAWSDFQAAFIPRQQIQKGDTTCHWIVSISLEVRDKLRTAQRIFALWLRCRVLDYLVATRCYKCQEYGHVARHCASEADAALAITPPVYVNTRRGNQFAPMTTISLSWSGALTL